MMELFFAFIVGAFIFSHSFPFRKGLLTNKILTLYLIFSTSLCVFFTFCQTDWLYNFMDFKPFPYIGFNWSLFLSVIIMAELCYLWERWFLYGFIEMVFIPWLNKKMGPRLPFEILEETLNNDTRWPKLDQDSDEYQNSFIRNSTDNEGFIRKSSKRHNFKADVVYESEIKPLTSHSIKKENSFFKKNVFKKEENKNEETLRQIQRHSSELTKEKLKLIEMNKQNALLDKSVSTFVEEENSRESTNEESLNVDQKSPGEGSNLIKEMNEQWIIIRNSLHESLKDVAPGTLDLTTEEKRYSSATN
ncbi:putative cation-transporting ATPase 13A5 [Armadillidium vulgare]|nr:putative cation-transporting ATPase 13A5 [Armadillidium vulgare]